MTFLITANEPRAHYTAGAAQTVFSIPFEWRTDSDIKVYVNEVQKTLNVDYTLTGAGVSGGGSCTFTSAMAGGEKVTIIGDMPIARGSESFTAGGQLPASVLEASLDNLTMVVKQLARDIARSMHLAPHDSANAANFTLPTAATRKGKYGFFFNATTGEPELFQSIGATAISMSILAALLWPQTAEETTAGETASNFNLPVVVQPFRFGGVGNGVANDTLAVQACIDVASVIGWNAEVDLCGRNWCVGTLKIDARHLVIRNGRLTAHSSIPAGGAVILSLAGGGDAGTNNALLDAIYGAGVQTARTVITGSLEQVRIVDVSIYGAANAVKGMWFTGFTRGCRIEGYYANGCDDCGLAINGSWSFLLSNIHCEGDTVNGTGIKMGKTGLGTRTGSVLCNGWTGSNIECTAHNNGFEFDFGVVAAITGLVCEFNANDGMSSQSANCVTLVSPYFEGNGADALEMGGTNGTDFVENWTVISPRFKQDAGHNMRLQGMKDCKIINPLITGTVTDWYFIGAGHGTLQTGCEFELPPAGFSASFISNFSTECNGTDNRWWNKLGVPFISVENASRDYDLRDPSRIVIKESGGAGETMTIKSQASMPTPIGTKLRQMNRGGVGTTMAIAITTDTLQHTLGTGTRTLAHGGYAEMTYVGSNIWMIEGSGIT